MGSSHATSARDILRSRFISGVLMVVAAAAMAQEVPTGWQPSNPFPEEEAPPVFFDLGTGDTEVDLYLLGSWTAQSRVATGIAFHPALPESGQRMTVPYQYPGFETELFAQTVDVTLSLWLYQNFFFEASFADSSDINTIAAGYIGDAGHPLQEVVVGNVPLTVGRYPYQYTGSPNARTGQAPLPGAVMRLQGARTYHELLVQLESSQARRLRLSSGGILTEERIPAHRYLPQARYVLPDRDISAVAVYLETPDGDILTQGGDRGGRRFRELDESAGEYTVDATVGTLRISGEIRESGRPVAVYYETSNGIPVGAPGAGKEALIPLDGTTLQPTDGPLLDFEFSGDSLLDRLTGDSITDDRVTESPTLEDYELPLADGRSALLLRQSGLWSPFEAANLYFLPDNVPLPEEDGLRTRLVNPGTRTPIDDEDAYRTRRIGDTRLVELVAVGAEARDVAWRYPFAERAPREAHAGIYGPGAADGGAPVELLVSYRTDQEELSLDGNVVPGTVQVTAAGRPVQGVEFDPASGRLTLPDSVPPAATVDVSYREYSSGGAGDLVAVSGNRWEATPRLSLALSAGIRWTLAEESFSTEHDEHPGQATLSTGATYRGQQLTVSAAAAMQLTQSDTTGVMRLAGATGRSTLITPDAETTFPGATPEGGLFDPANRAEAAYRDYWSVDAVGNVSLLPYGRSPAADEPRSGARVGPYLAASTDQAYSGPVAVLEWNELSPEQWVGAQIRVTGGETDLSTARSVTVRYLVLPPVSSYTAAPPEGGTPELRLDLGALEEDLDGDGVLDEGRSPVDPLLEFDAPQGLRHAGQDAPRLAAAHSEDGNSNGILDGEVPGGVFSHTESLSGARKDWQTLTVPLDGRARSRLAATRAIRLTLRNAALSESVSGGRLLIGTVEVVRTTEAVVISSGGGSADVAVTEDPLAGNGGELRRRFSVVGDRLASDPDSQRVYALNWSGATAAEVAFETEINEFSPNRYDTLSLFLYLDAEDAPVSDTRSDTQDASATPQDAATPEESVEVRLAPYGTAPEDAGVTVTLPAAKLTGAWHQVDISLADGTVRIDGSPTAFPTTIPEDGDYLRTVQVAVQGLPEGTLYMDELHAGDPTAGFSTAGDANAIWQHEFSSGRLAGTRMTVEQRIIAQGDGFRAGTANPSATGGSDTAMGRVLRSTSLLRGERGLLLTEVETALETDGTAGSGAFGHRLHVPLLPGGVLLLQERFYRDYASRSALADREMKLTSSGAWGTWSVSTANRADPREILQSWNLAAAPPDIGPVGSSLTADVSVRSLDQAVNAEPYGASWLAGTARVIPLAQKDDRQERSGSAGGTVRAGNFEFTSTAAWNSRASISQDQSDRLEFGAQWPLSFRADGARPWEIRPEYRRRWTLQRTSDGESLWDDLSHWGGSVVKDTPIVSAIPLAELFQSAPQLGYEALGEGDLTRGHDAEARLRFVRAPGSRPRDLYVPSEISAGIARARIWESDSLSDQRTWELGIAATAINLYGAQGSRPRFLWYQSDEFENRVTVQIDEPVGGRMKWGVTVNQATRLFGFNDTDGELSTSIDLAGPDTHTITAASSATFRWRSLRYPRLDLFSRLQEDPYYQHEERLTVRADFEDAAYQGNEVVARHRTTLVIDSNGEITAYGDLGWLADPAQYENGMLHAIGLQIGIEGRLQY